MIFVGFILLVQLNRNYLLTNKFFLLNSPFLDQLCYTKYNIYSNCYLNLLYHIIKVIIYNEEKYHVL